MYSTIEEANLKVNNGSELGVESFLFEGVEWGFDREGPGIHILIGGWG